MSNETSKMVNGKSQSQTRMGTAGTTLASVNISLEISNGNQT
jgi:hypothetical protein